MPGSLRVYSMKEILNRGTNENEEISIRDIFLRIHEAYVFLLSKWIIILIFGLLGGTVGYFYMKSKKNVFTSLTSFVLEDGEPGGGLGQYSGIASMIGVDISGNGGSIFQGDNLLELYKSRAMISKTLLSTGIFDGREQLIIDRYFDFNKSREKWKNDDKLKSLNFITRVNGKLSRIQDSIISMAVTDINRNYLIVSKPDKKAGIINVVVRGADEQFCINFNNQIVLNVSEFYVQTKTKKSLKNLLILQEQTDSIRGIVNNSIKSVAVSNDAFPNANPSKQVLKVPIQRKQIDVETNKAILTELVKNLEISKVALRKETPLIQIIDSPVLPLPMEKPSGLKGLIIGGILSGLATIIYLFVRRYINNMMI